MVGTNLEYGKVVVFVLYPPKPRTSGPFAANAHVEALSFANPTVKGPNATAPVGSNILNWYELFNVPKSSASADNPIKIVSVIAVLTLIFRLDTVPKLR